MNNNELMHHGIHGMRWGVRRYQNKDGSLTAAGRKRINQLDSEYQKLTGKKLSKSSESNTVKKTSAKPKKISEMTNEEIQEKINRIRLERTLESLTPKEISSGEKFAKFIGDSTVKIAKERGTKVAGDLFEKKLREMTGLRNSNNNNNNHNNNNNNNNNNRNNGNNG